MAMEKAPRPGANDQPESHHRGPDWPPKGVYSDCQSLAEQKYDDWEWVLNKHENLRQLIKQSPSSVVDTDRWGRHRQPNMLLAGYPRGPVSQAFGWAKIALDSDLKPEFDHLEVAENYRGDPVEQSLLWLIMNFEPVSADPDIIEVVELLSDGLVELAHERLEDYIGD